MLLLLLNRFSHVQLCATPEMAAHQALPSLGFSRQEHWSGLPFPSPMHEGEKWKWVTQSCLTLRNPKDCSSPVSSIHGIFQARVLEWGAIAFSSVYIYTTGPLCCTAGIEHCNSTILQQNNFFKEHTHPPLPIEPPSKQVPSYWLLNKSTYHALTWHVGKLLKVTSET